VIVVIDTPHLNAVINWWSYTVIAHLKRYCSKKTVYSGKNRPFVFCINIKMMDRKEYIK